MLRVAMLAALVTCCGMFTGCCSGPCGPCGGGFGVGLYSGGGCGDDCGGCDSGWNHRYAARSPLQSMHLMRKRLVCGSGCGETYYGEWRSHPPDCCDPCEFDYSYGEGFGCGGCGGCDECCLFSPPPRRRPMLGIFSAIYGDRYCEGCDDCGGGYYDGGYYGEGGGGCASGDCGGYASNSQPRGIAPASMVQRRPMMRRGMNQQAMAQQSMPQQRTQQETMAQSIPEPKRVARQPGQPSTGRLR